MNMRKIFIVCAVLLALFANFYAQGFSETTDAESENAYKIDEFGRLGNCDTGARLDNFLVTLQNKPDSGGVIIIYKSVEALPGNDFSFERVYRNYFLMRNADTSRIEIINGGFREDYGTELWIVPPGAPTPQPSETLPKPELPTDKTFLFDINIIDQRLYETLEVGIFDYNAYLDEYILPAVKAAREAEQKALEEEWKSDDSEEVQTDEPQIIEEETEAEQPKTPEEIEAEKFFWINEKFGEVIKNQKDASGVIIFYADDQTYDIALLQTFIDEGRDKIANFSGISPAKIQIVFGGYRTSAEAEFWIMPKNGAFPTPTPENRPVEEVEENESNQENF